MKHLKTSTVWHQGTVWCVAIALSDLCASTPAAQAQPVFRPAIIVYEPPKPAVVEPAAPVAALIDRLSNTLVDSRETASAALLAMGPGIRPQLQWALEHEEAAIPAADLGSVIVPGTNRMKAGPANLLPRYAFHELNVLLDRMDEQTESSASTITLHENDTPLFDVLRDLGRQAKTRVEVAPSTLPQDWVNTTRISVDLDRVSLWQALSAIQKIAGVAFARKANVLSIDKGNPHIPLDAPHSIVTGPMLILPLSAEARQTVDYVSGTTAKTVTLTLEAFAEPMLVRAGSHARIQVSECVDDQGKSLLISGPQEFPAIDSMNEGIWNVPVQLMAPDPGRRIQSLRGILEVGIGPPVQTLTVPHLARADGQSLYFDELMLTVNWPSSAINAFLSGSSNYWVGVQLSARTSRLTSEGHYGIGPRNMNDGKPAPIPDSPVTANLKSSNGSDRFALWDDMRQAIRIDRVFNSATWGTLRKLDASRIPATLAWTTPAETRWHATPFELQDIPVP